ncbi:MAG: iron chaperone [Phycisphaerales bacterium]
MIKETSRKRRVGNESKGFTDAEKTAMKERARELKAEARAGKDKASGERAVLAKIAEMPQSDRTLGERLHAIVRANAPNLSPKLWYGMPAYANKDGKVVCFFQAAAKFKTRYASFAFMDTAKLDEGAGGMWATGFGLKAMTTAEEAKIGELVKKAVIEG